MTAVVAVSDAEQSGLLVLGPLHGSVSRARDHARFRAIELGASAEQAGDIVAVVSELVTNAIQASRPVSYLVPWEIWLRLYATGTCVLIEVGDYAPGWPELSAPPAADSEHGRGLVLVAALAEDWGCRETTSGRPGKITWARVCRPKPAPPATKTLRGPSA
jgi:anti-sigma regulatory factor (Ser/Thr protein kinase)